MSNELPTGVGPHLGYIGDDIHQEEIAEPKVEKPKPTEGELMKAFFFPKRTSSHPYRSCTCGLDSANLIGKHSAWCDAYVKGS